MIAGTKVQELELALRKVGSDPIVVLISGHPDPDAIGSALAHQRICQRLGLQATIAHALPISRSENRALVKLLNIQMVEIRESKDLERYSYLSLVDTSAPEATVRIPESLQLLSVVDHHRSRLEVDAPFVDIRLAAGATSTMYAEYTEQGIAPLTQEARDDVRVATALLFGIQTDTDDFSRANADDFRAAAYLKPFCDPAVLDRVGHRSLAAETMDALGRALADLEVVRDFALAGVGPVSVSHRDSIPAAADFILKREDIDTVIVFGIVGDRVDGSLRTNSPSLDPGLFLDSAFGTDPSGRPYGGGRSDKGGFQIPLGMLAEVQDDAAIWSIARRMVRQRLARAIPGLDRKD